MTVKPFVTFLTSVYNAEKYLNQYFDTMTNQTCQDFEVVFWDDCSTDNSYAVIRDFIDNHSEREGQYRLYKAEKNGGGFQFCLPKVVDHLNGEYLFLVTQDDFIDKDFVEVCRKKSLEKDYDIILTNLAFYKNGKTTFLGREYSRDFADGKLTNRDFFRLSLTWKVSTAGLRKLSLMKKEGLFDDTYYNIDEYVGRKTLLTAKEIGYADTTFYYRVDNPNALTRKMRPFTFDILTTGTMLTDVMIGENFDKDSVVEQIRHMTAENNYYVFGFFENIGNYSDAEIIKIRQKLDNAYEKILSYYALYDIEPKNLYSVKQVEEGVLYKSKGLPPFLRIKTYRKRENKIRTVELFGLQIAKWIVKKKRKKL